METSNNNNKQIYIQHENRKDNRNTILKQRNKSKKTKKQQKTKNKNNKHMKK